MAVRRLIGNKGGRYGPTKVTKLGVNADKTNRVRVGQKIGRR